MTMPEWRTLGLLLAAAATEIALAQSDGPADTLEVQRAEFQHAYGLARAGETPEGLDSATLQRYSLYPYLQAERIAAALGEPTETLTAADEEAGRFLADHDAEPVGMSLRRVWLSSLARRRAWDAYLEHYRPEVADQRLRCHHLEARIARERLEGIAPDIIDEWLTGYQLPTECEPVFTWLRDEGSLTDELIEQRVRLLLGNGQAAFARIIAGRLPADRAMALLQWADLIERPAEAIDAHIALLTPELDPEALLDGWSRLARNDPAGALERYGELMAAKRFDREQASPYALALALGLAWDRRPESLGMFDSVSATDLDDYALEWRARAASWVGDWGLVDESVAGMSEHQRTSAAWRYWAARAAEARRNRPRARGLYESLLSDDNFYSAMAATRLRKRVQPNPSSLPLDSMAVADLTTQPAFVRARELFHAGLRIEAMREWRHAFADLDPGTRAQSIHVATNLQWYDLAVATATQHGIFNDYELLYPRPFTSAVLPAIRSTELGAALIYGVIRQESLYRADAVSSAGARGLMQLLPDTARRVAPRLGVAEPTHDDLFEPGLNIRLGAAELERLMERYDGQLPVALAAYNAGPNAADRWLPEDPLDSDIWIDNIPYNETRAYVRRVLWHTIVFQWLETGRPQSTRSWASTIARPDDFSSVD